MPTYETIYVDGRIRDDGVVSGGIVPVTGACRCGFSIGGDDHGDVVRVKGVAIVLCVLLTLAAMPVRANRFSLAREQLELQTTNSPTR